MLSRPALSLTLLLFLFILNVSATCDRNNYWINPVPPSTGPTSVPFPNVPQWTPGQTMSLTWVAAYSTFSLGIWYQSDARVAGFGNFGEPLLTRTDPTPQTWTATWVVSSLTATSSSIYDPQYYFEFGYGGLGGTEKCAAPSFRVVATSTSFDAAAAEAFSYEPLSSTMTTTTTTTTRRASLGRTATSTAVATRTGSGFGADTVTVIATATRTSTGGGPGATGDAGASGSGSANGNGFYTTSSGSGGLSTDAKVGIGLGVGVGVPLIALAAFFLGRYHRKRRAVGPQGQNVQENGYLSSQQQTAMTGGAPVAGDKCQGAGPSAGVFRYS